MDYSKETADLIERMCQLVERKDFKLNKKKSEELILKTYDLFGLKRPSKIVWCKDIFDEKFSWSAWSAWSARSARSAWSAGSAWSARNAGSAGSAMSAWSAGSAWSARNAGSAGSAWSAWSAWSARSAGSAGSAMSAWSAGSARNAGSAGSAMSAWSAGSAWGALDYDFDYFVIEHEYIKNRKDNPGNEPNESDFKYLEYSELLIQAMELGLGYRVEWEDTLYLVPTPLVLIDNENRFHSEDKPAIRWKNGKKLYYLHGVNLEKDWHTKIVKDKLSPEEILAIVNTEHRRIAWEYMDKKKLEGLDGFQVIDTVEDDGKGYPMRIIQFNHPDAGEIRYYNCFCPTTGREYYLGTEEKTCKEAKAKSFGLEKIDFIEEW